MAKLDVKPTTEQQVREGQKLLQTAIDSEDPVTALIEIGIRGQIAIVIAGTDKAVVEIFTQKILENRPQSSDPKIIAANIASDINSKL
ncbi:MAG: hypothetical protein ABID64_03955 [Nitrospirota bacterium]